MNSTPRKVLAITLITGFLFSTTVFAKKLKKKQPNILFCIADDATWMHLGAYGCSWVKTPSFDRIAANGILFNNAYTPNAKSAPSRSTILTGRNSWQLEEAGNHICYFPAKFKSVAEALSENGYEVGYTGKGWAPGDMGSLNGQARDLLVQAYNGVKTKAPTTGISNVDYAENFNYFLDKRDKEKPFFFWYGGFEPHRKYEYGSGIRLANKTQSDIDYVPSFWPDVDSVRVDMLDYAYELEYFDRQLEKILAYLEKSGELDNTLIVVTSDNGMPFPRAKGQDYEYSNHLPLAVMWKNGIIAPGRKVDDFVSFIDFAPTFAEVSKVNVEEKGMKSIEGKSLVPLFQSSQSGQVEKTRNYVLLGRERHDVGRPGDQGFPIRAIRKGDFLYIKNYETDRWPAGNPETGYLDVDGSPTKSYILNLRRKGKDKEYWHYSFGKRETEELYNVKTDRDCMKNLINEGQYFSLKNDLKTRMEEELKKQGDPRMFGNGAIFDSYKPVGTVNFYERYLKGEKLRTKWVNKSDYETDSIALK